MTVMRLYLAADSAAVTHPLPRRQHFLTERRVATREIQSNALLLFVERLLSRTRSPSQGSSAGSAPRDFLLFFTAMLPGFAPPYSH